MGYTFQFGVIEANFDQFLYGLALGLALAFAAILVGTLIGLVCAFATMAKAPLPRACVGIYVSAIRNTPLLVIVLFVYFALPQLGIRLGKLESFVFSLAIYSGAYLTEVFRAGLPAFRVASSMRAAPSALPAFNWRSMSSRPSCGAIACRLWARLSFPCSRIRRLPP